MMKKTRPTLSAIALIGISTAAHGALITHFEFEAVSGTTVADSSGLGNTGTLAGNATYAAGFGGGNSISLDGLDATIRLSDATLVGNDDQTSVAAWVFGGASNLSEATTWWWGAGNTDGSGRIQQVHLPWNDSKVYWRAPGGQISYTSSGTESAGGWNHWAFTKNGTTGDIKIYLNGAEVGSGTGAGSTTVAASWLGSQGGTSRFWEGFVDDFRVYNHELSASEVAALAVPEPSVALLGGLGLLGLLRRRK